MPFLHIIAEGEGTESSGIAFVVANFGVELQIVLVLLNSLNVFKKRAARETAVLRLSRGNDDAVVRWCETAPETPCSLRRPGRFVLIKFCALSSG